MSSLDRTLRGWALTALLALSPLPALAEDQCEILPNSTGYSLNLQLTYNPTAGADLWYLVGAFPTGSGDWLMWCASRTTWRYRPFNSESDLCVGPSFVRTGLRQVTSSTGSFLGSFQMPQAMPGEEWHFQVWHTDFVLPTGQRVNTSRVLTRTFQ